jgi:para-aminobenzoate synthetase/4-amino-4-deoxychorismate lyase
VEEDGLHGVGFLTYEAAAGFGLPVRAPAGEGLPLLWFGLYADPRELPRLPRWEAGRCEAGPWRPSLDEAAYARAIARIRERIAAGDTYQVNFTFALEAPFAGDPWSFFLELAAAQRGGRAAYLDLGSHVVCGVSPELFFRRDGEALTTRPMKGTAPRGRSRHEDERRRAALHASPKDRAENLMIVDMMRNDLGRVARWGTVEVPELFTVERYPTLLQMTSTVKARSGADLTGVVSALFPCASVTGAPKRSTMEIIRGLEERPRGLYTGAIGHLAPRRRAEMSVAIRTVIVDRRRGRAEYGVGSGIVWDSVAEEEYAECLLKAKVLEEKPFGLLEALLWTPEDGYFLLDAHVDRLLASADHFGIVVEPGAVRAELAALGATLSGPAKVRLTVGGDGALALEAAPLEAEPTPLRVGLAAAAVDAASPWLHHKTTRREAYDAALASRPDCDDVLLWNERGELTEATRSNVVVDLGEGPVTPPLECGLLAGTFRARLLAEGRIRERVVRAADLEGARAVFLVSSVRFWRPARLRGTGRP